jgi:hypothetical protein
MPAHRGALRRKTVGGVAMLRTRHGLRCRPRVTASAQVRWPDVPTLGRRSGRTGRGWAPRLRGPVGDHLAQGVSKEDRQPYHQQNRLSPRHISPLPQHNPSHRAAADALDAGEQFRLSRPPAAAVVTYPLEDGTDRYVVLPHVRLGAHLDVAAAVTFDAQEPRRERGERFVEGFDEAISQRQLDKIATLETEIAPRRLTADQEKTLAALFAKFPGQMVLFESYGKETEPFMLGMQILGTATEAGLPKKNELMTVDAIAGVKTGLCLSGTNKDFIEATKSAFLSFQMAPCALLGTPGAFSTVVSADEAFPLRIFVGIKPLSEETPHAAAETPHTAAHPIIRQNRSQRPWRLGL